MSSCLAESFSSFCCPAWQGIFNSSVATLAHNTEGNGGQWDGAHPLLAHLASRILNRFGGKVIRMRLTCTQTSKYFLGDAGKVDLGYIRDSCSFSAGSGEFRSKALSELQKVVLKRNVSSNSTLKNTEFSSKTCNVLVCKACTISKRIWNNCYSIRR